MAMFEFLREWLESFFGPTSFMVGFTILGLYIIFWLLVGILLSIIVSPMIRHFLKVNQKIAKRIPLRRDEAYTIVDASKRGETVSKALVSIFRFIIWFIIALIVLDGFNVNIAPILASAGVVGVAVAFGTQAIVKDFVSGIFIIMENTFSIGELVQISGFTGIVKEVGIRTTKIEDWKGDYFIVNNGSVGNVINYSRDYSIAVVDMTLGFDIDYSVFETAVNEFLKQYDNTNPAIVELPVYLGMVESGSNFMKVRITAKCRPTEHFGVERLLRQQLFTLFQQHGFAIPIQKIELISGDGHGSGH
jgi:moderate conductance mechanosensitive channel